jgi:hypothetical protein
VLSLLSPTAPPPVFYKRSRASFKVPSPESAVSCFFFQFIVSSFPKGHPVAAYIFLLIFPTLYLSLNNIFQNAVPVENVTIPVNLPSFNCMQDVLFLLDPLKYIIFHMFGATGFFPPPATHFRTFKIFLILQSVKVLTP